MFYRLSWKEWRYQVRYLAWGFVQRGWRGWADRDVWGMDHHLAGIIAPMLRRLADNAHGYPGRHPGQTDNDCFETFEDWQAWLREKAEWFDWYATDEMLWDSSKTAYENERLMEEYRARHDKFRKEVLPDFVKWWGALWD